MCVCLYIRPDGYGTPSTELLTDYHHNSVRWCVWNVGDFPIECDKDIKMGRLVVYSVWCSTSMDSITGWPRVCKL